jgi:hypothetical protein
MGGHVLRTAIQTIRCLWLGSYYAAMVEGQLRVRGPVPMAACLQESVRDNRVEIIELLETYCGGMWPPMPGSEIYGYEEVALKVLEIREVAA